MSIELGLRPHGDIFWDWLPMVCIFRMCFLLEVPLPALWMPPAG